MTLSVSNSWREEEEKEEEEEEEEEEEKHRVKVSKKDMEEDNLKEEE